MGEPAPVPSARHLDLARRLAGAEAALEAVDPDDPDDPLTPLFSLDASPVGGRIGIRLPPGAVRARLEIEETEEAGLFLLREPRDVLEAIESLDGLFQPPWDELDERTREEIEAAEFTSAYAGTRESVMDLLWRAMLPAPLYRIEWATPLPPPPP